MVKAKIIATLGPASNKDDVIKDMIRAGMDIVRVNMSHATTIQVAQDYLEQMNKINQVMNTNIPIMLDLKGPELRVGEVEPKTYLKKGSIVTLVCCNCEVVGNANEFSINPNCKGQLEIGDIMVVNDTALKLKVVALEPKVKIEVLKSDYLASRKGVHVLDKSLHLPFLNLEDKATLKFADDNNIPYVALSFVRYSKEIKEAKAFINNPLVKVYTKIETKEAIDNLDEIINDSDGIIIARGDLSITMPYHELGIITKKITDACLEQDKPVYVATDLLQSMMTKPVPNKSEIADITHVIQGGVTGCLLSGETAVGKYPVECVAVLNDIMAIVEREGK